MNLSVLKSIRPKFALWAYLIVIPVCFIFGSILIIIDFPRNIVAAIAILVASLIIIKFDYGLYSWILLSAIGIYIGFDLPGLPSFYTVELLLIFLLAIWIVRILALKKNTFISSPINKILVLMLGWAAISIMGAQFLGAVDSNQIKWQVNTFLCIFFAFSAYYLIANIIRSKQDVFNILIFIVLASLPISAIQYLNFFFAGMGIGYNERVFSAFNGNFLGAFYILVFFVLLFFLLEVKNNVLKILIGSYMGIILLNIIITFSRGTFLSFLAAFATILLILKKKGLAIGAIFFVFLFLIFPQFTQWSSYFSENYIGETRDISGRLPIFIDALRIIKENPVFGIGLSNYKIFSTVLEWKIPLNRYSVISSSHNDYLQVAVYMGLFGLVLYLALLYYIWKESITFYRGSKDHFRKRLGIIFIAIFFSFLVQNFFSGMIIGTHSYSTLSARIYFWILLGVLVGSKNLSLKGANAYKEGV